MAPAATRTGRTHYMLYNMYMRHAAFTLVVQGWSVGLLRAAGVARCAVLVRNSRGAETVLRWCSDGVARAREVSQALITAELPLASGG